LADEFYLYKNYLMKNCLLLFAVSLCFHFSDAQVIKKVPVSNSGCSVYSYCDFVFEKEFSQDSSIVYVSECVKNEVNYGIICVKLSLPTDNLPAAEESLINYLDYLKSSFKIINSAGYGRGHQLANNENTRGVLDYWNDRDKNHWKVKAWTNGKYIGVLYGYSLKELPESKLNVFLEGFRFPEM
jgi:hypothetical protein